MSPVCTHLIVNYKYYLTSCSAMQTPSGMESSCRFLDNTENSEFMHIYVIGKFTRTLLTCFNIVWWSRYRIISELLLPYCFVY